MSFTINQAPTIRVGGLNELNPSSIQFPGSSVDPPPFIAGDQVDVTVEDAGGLAAYELRDAGGAAIHSAVVADAAPAKSFSVSLAEGEYALAATDSLGAQTTAIFRVNYSPSAEIVSVVRDPPTSPDATIEFDPSARTTLSVRSRAFWGVRFLKLFKRSPGEPAVRTSEDVQNLQAFRETLANGAPDVPAVYADLPDGEYELWALDMINMNSIHPAFLRAVSAGAAIQTVSPPFFPSGELLVKPPKGPPVLCKAEALKSCLIRKVEEAERLLLAQLGKFTSPQGSDLAFVIETLSPPTGPVAVELGFDPAGLSPEQLASIRMLQLGPGGALDVTTALNLTTFTVRGAAPTLDPLIVAVPLPPGPPATVAGQASVDGSPALSITSYISSVTITPAPSESAAAFAAARGWTLIGGVHELGPAGAVFRPVAQAAFAYSTEAVLAAGHFPERVEAYQSADAFQNAEKLIGQAVTAGRVTAEIFDLLGPQPARAAIFAVGPKDATPPETRIEFLGGAVFAVSGASYVSSGTSVALSALDAGAPVSGLDGVFALLDEVFLDTAATPGSRVAGPIPLPPGAHRLTLYSRDRAGNVEPPRTELLLVDAAAPQAALLVGAATAALESPILTDDATPISLSASDPEILASTPGAGVANVFYLVDATPEQCGIAPGELPAADPVQPRGTCENPVFGAPFTLPTGEHQIAFWAADRVANVSGVRVATISVRFSDTEPPTATLFLQGEGFEFTDEQGLRFTAASRSVGFAASDAGTPFPSGVDAIFYIVDPAAGILAAGLSDATSTQFTLYGGTFSLLEGERVLAWGARDRAATYEALQSTRLFVDGTAPVSSFTVLGSSELVNGILRFPETALIDITAFDPVSNGMASGVGEISFLIDTTEEECEALGIAENDAAPQGSCANQHFESPFALAPGSHTLRWSSADEVGNESGHQELQVEVLIVPRRLVWTGGAGDGRWHTAGNWDGNLVPRSSDTVLIDGPGQPVIDVRASPISFSHLILGGVSFPELLRVSAFADASSLTVRNAIVEQHGLGSLVLAEHLIVEAGGRLTHAANGGVFAHHLSLSVGGDAVIAAGGELDATGKGFAGGTFFDRTGSGPGGGVVQGPFIGGMPSGGSHIGETRGEHEIVTAAYDDPINPAMPGSGGAAVDNARGGAGGGLIRLAVTGNLALAGIVRAAGAAATQGSSSDRAGGGGGGGSIILTAGALAGTGSVDASGGASSIGRFGGSGGGGGAIRLEVAGALDPQVALRAYGGAGLNGSDGAGKSGGAGTIAIVRGGGEPELIVGGAGAPRVPESFTLAPATAPRSLTVIGGRLKTARLESLESLRLEGGAFVTAPSSLTPLAIAVGGELFVDARSTIGVAGLGYAGATTTNAGGEGPGGGKRDGNRGGAGGGHGGAGGSSAVRTGGDAYDDAFDPTQPGSGGAQTFGGAGGGVVAITAASARIDGLVDARGLAGAGGNLGSGGGGSGGTIRLAAGGFSGAGRLDASGGGGAFGISGTSGGGGGGGRVLVRGIGAKAAPWIMRAEGGRAGNANESHSGGAGTIVLDEPGQAPSLIIAASFAPEGPGSRSLTPLSVPLVLDRFAVSNALVASTAAAQPISVASLTLAGVYSLTATTLSFPTAGLSGFTIPAQSNLTLLEMSREPGWSWDIAGSFSLPKPLFASSVTVSGSLIVPELAFTGTLEVTGQLSAAALTVPDGFRLDGALTTSRITSAGSVTFGPAARLTHPQGGAGSLTLEIGGDLTMAQGAVIDLTGKGYPAGQGPGTSPGHYGSPGAGHGGYGGDAAFEGAGATEGGGQYGSLADPRLAGSGPGRWDGGGGTGGGVLLASIGGTLTHDGLIAANGTNGGSAMGGASGGSVNITAAAVAGTGVVRADGGDGGSPSGGGGAGGRIAVRATGASLVGWTFGAAGGRGQASTFPSTKRQGYNGGGGTAYLKDPALPGFSLRIGGPDPLPPNGQRAVTLFDQPLAFDALAIEDAWLFNDGKPITLGSPPELRSGASLTAGVLSFPAGLSAIAVSAGSIVDVSRIDSPDLLAWRVDGRLIHRNAAFAAASLIGKGDVAVTTMSVSGDVELETGALLRIITGSGTVGGDFLLRSGSTLTVEAGRGLLALQVGGDFTLAAGAVVDLVGKGLRDGPGRGGSGPYDISGGGGGYGGRGGNGNPGGAGGGSYGDPGNPIEMGSGGGGNGRGAGGGALLRIAGRVVVDGRIDASGTNTRLGDGGGGGSGGAINLCGNENFSGSGELRADGGNGSASGLGAGGGGGGGRICAPVGRYTGTLSAKAGKGGSAAGRSAEDGEDGTIRRTPSVVASADSVAELTSFSPTAEVVQVATPTATEAFTAAKSETLVSVVPFYEIELGTQVVDEPPVLRMSFDPTGVDTATIAIYRFNGVDWDSTTVINQSIVFLAADLAEISGTLLTTSLFGLFFEHPDKASPPLTAFAAGEPRFEDAQGRLFVGAGTPLGFLAEDFAPPGIPPSGVELTRYRVDGETFQVFGASFTLAAGTRRIEFQSQDVAGNLELLRSATVFVDAGAPASALALMGPSFVDADGAAFASTRTTVALAAEDPEADGIAAGVSRVEYRVDADSSAPFAVFTSTFALAQGLRRIEFRAVDLVENLEPIRVASVAVDGSAPLSRLVIGEPQRPLPDGTLFVSSRTPMELVAEDGPELASGVDGSFVALGTGPFTQTAGPFHLFHIGALTLRYFSRDRVGNAEPEQTIRLVVDDPAPKLAFLSPAPDENGICRVLNGVAAIAGSVADDTLREWRLEAAPGKNAQAGFIFVASGTRATEGLLGQWNTAGFSGFATLRLSAHDSGGNTAAVSLDVFVGEPARLLTVDGRGELKRPEGIAAAPGGRIVVADAGNELVRVFDSSGALQASFGNARQLAKEPYFKAPSGVAADGAGNLWVADTGQHRVVKLSPAGEFLLAIGDFELKRGVKKFRHGSGPGQLKDPAGVALGADGKVYIADAGNRRVQVFDPDGSFLRGFALPPTAEGEPGRPVAVAVDAAGKIYAADREGRRALTFSPEGEPLASIGGFQKPAGIAVSPSGRCILVADRDTGRVSKFDANGSLLLASLERGFKHPAGVALDAAGNLLLAESGADSLHELGLPEAPTLIVSLGGRGRGMGTSSLAAAAEQAPATAAARVGARGGAVFSPARAGVRVPEAALDEEFELAVLPASDDARAQERRTLRSLYAGSDGVELGPHGLSFDRPVTVVLPYDPAQLALKGVREAELRVHYWNPERADWESLPSELDLAARTVSARVLHFSRYQALGPGTGEPLITPAAGADAAFRLREVYAFPNPAVRGAAPVLHVEVGIADSVRLRIFNIAGQLMHETALSGTPKAIDDGTGAEYAYEHPWNGHIPSGVYLYTVVAEKGGQAPIRTSGKFAVVR